ncbi:formyltransferase family protein [Pseudophaeobacter arcticus]|jgi:methionyl-tRNA formyltransferase|uniref:formyltransferase family protein n=1 Tax=Pseudophaeobacter arcticus TaxID=385492 RepID=UPI0039E634F3
MRIDLLCTNRTHPVVPSLRDWISARARDHTLRLIHDKSDLQEGDILFLVSCSQLIARDDRARYRTTMVLHASDLPEGRGWSPHVWDILAGREELTLSLLTAEDGVDSGAIWAKRHFHVPRHALSAEINALLFEAELALMDRGIEMVAAGEYPQPQPDAEASYHPRRTPEDSRLDPSQPLAELFDRIRVADPDRYPAFFEMHGKTFELTLKKREI